MDRPTGGEIAVADDVVFRVEDRQIAHTALEIVAHFVALPAVVPLRVAVAWEIAGVVAVDLAELRE